MFTDSSVKVLQVHIVNLLTTHNRQKMTAQYNRVESCTVMGTTVIPREIRGNGSEIRGNTAVLGMTVAVTPR